MTAEVAILNKMAVALAADSKVTVGSGRHAKTYDTVNKLFTLSKIHPVGIVIYGNAEFMQYPWETVIKLYREHLGEKCFDHLDEYSVNFFEFLRRDFEFSSGDQEENVKNIVRDAFREVIQDLESVFLDVSGHIPKNLIKRNLVVSIEKRIDQLSNLPLVDVFSTTPARHFKDDYIGVIEDICDEFFAPWMSKGLRRKLVMFSLLVLQKEKRSGLSSGIVFAGFGEGEKFPSLEHYVADGVVCGQVKHWKVDEVDVSRDMRGAIIPFAQSEMVYCFMEGIDTQYQAYLESKFVSFFLRAVDSVIDVALPRDSKRKEDLKEKCLTESITACERFVDEARVYRQSSFVDPVVEMMVLLPKEELANMAESLVNLTSLKRRVSREIESVGGAVDVAVISKGDGFIWIKRKHYFDATLNHGFLTNYFRDIQCIGDSDAT